MRSLLRVASIFALLAAVAGAADAGADLRLVGASTLLAAARDAAQRLQRDSGLKADIRGGGSDAALRALMKGQADVAMVARELTSEEARELTAYPIGLDGIAVIVNAGNPLRAVTHEQVRALFSGRINDWREFGLAKAAGPTIPVVKGPAHDARAMFDAHFGVGSLLPTRAVELGSNTAVVLYVSMDPAAVGYVSMGVLEQARRRGLNIKGLTLDGAEPGIGQCAAKRYPLCRPLQLVTRGRARGQGRRFIEFFAGPEGRAVVERHGFAPVPGSAP